MASRESGRSAGKTAPLGRRPPARPGARGGLRRARVTGRPDTLILAHSKGCFPGMLHLDATFAARSGPTRRAIRTRLAKGEAGVQDPARRVAPPAGAGSGRADRDPGSGHRTAPPPEAAGSRGAVEPDGCLSLRDRGALRAAGPGAPAAPGGFGQPPDGPVRGGSVARRRLPLCLGRSEWRFRGAWTVRRDHRAPQHPCRDLRAGPNRGRSARDHRFPRRGQRLPARDAGDPLQHGGARERRRDRHGRGDDGRLLPPRGVAPDATLRQGRD